MKTAQEMQVTLRTLYSCTQREREKEREVIKEKKRNREWEFMCLDVQKITAAAKQMRKAIRTCCKHKNVAKECTFNRKGRKLWYIRYIASIFYNIWYLYDNLRQLIVLSTSREAFKLAMGTLQL